MGFLRTPDSIEFMQDNLGQSDVIMCFMRSSHWFQVKSTYVLPIGLNSLTIMSVEYLHQEWLLFCCFKSQKLPTEDRRSIQNSQKGMQVCSLLNLYIRLKLNPFLNRLEILLYCTKPFANLIMILNHVGKAVFLWLIHSHCFTGLYSN